MEDDTRIENIRISGMHELDGETNQQTTDIVKKTYPEQTPRKQHHS